MSENPKFNHIDLTLLNPSFDSSLVDVLTELERLRSLQLQGSTPAPIFFQLKSIFHMLESLGSARIEGNHTTLADFVDSRIVDSGQVSDQLREIENIEKAMAFVEQSLASGGDITEHFIRQLHDMTVKQLIREGDSTPGAYRLGSVRIAKSSHLPPEGIHIPGYMQEFTAFINAADPRKYDLIKVALAHHRFSWIHPFGNGNGRVVRLLTYAMLIKYGFNVAVGGRVLNPTAVFCNDREKYYTMLGLADSGNSEGLEAWCVYVLQGMLVELGKVDRLADYSYLQSRIFAPALAYAKNRRLITPLEESVLKKVILADGGVVKAADLEDAMPTKTAAQKTYQIKKLVESKMLQPIAQNSRKYTIGISNSYLMRGIVQSLADEGFIPQSLQGPA